MRPASGARPPALWIGVLLVFAGCGDGAVPTIANFDVSPSEFQEGEPVIFSMDVDPNGTTVRQIQVEVGRRDNAQSPVFWQERIQAWIQLEGETSFQCCWISPRSITVPFQAWLSDDAVVYTKSGSGWDLRGVITYRRDGDSADRTAFGATATQLTN